MTKQVTLSDIHSLVKSHFPFATMEKHISFTSDGETFCTTPILEETKSLKGYVCLGFKTDHIQPNYKNIWVSENRGFGIIITEYDVGAVIKDGDYSIITAKPKERATFSNDFKDDAAKMCESLEKLKQIVKVGIDDGVAFNPLDYYKYQRDLGKRL